MKEYKPFKSGKVRELYDLGDSLIMVCTDRISAFDNILENPIPKKGEVLNKMSKFWFDFTKDVVPNHMISIDAADMPVFFRKPEFDGNSMKPKAGDDSCRMHCSRIHHRFRLGKLQKRRHHLRYPSAGRA